MWTCCLRSSSRVLIVAVVTLVSAAAGRAAGPDPCLECHGVAGFDAPGRELWIHAEAYASGVHGRLACADCHKGAEGVPHGEVRVRCDLPCHVPDASHAALSAAEQAGVHAGLADPPCLACHGGGGLPEDPDALCQGCHPQATEPLARYPDTAGAFGVRGHAEAGERAPGCSACHGVHGVEAGPQAREACGAAACHPDAGEGFRELFDHDRRSDVRAWGGAARGLGWAGAAVALMLGLHALGRRP